MSSTTLYFERKDADALAVCASASLYSTELDVKSVSGVQGLPKAVALPLPAAGLPVLALPSGVIVQGAAAACASLLGGAKLSPGVRAAADNWLEVAEATLRPALLDHAESSGAAVGDLPAVQSVAAALVKREWLDGDAASAADALVGCLLLSCGETSSFGAELQAYLERLQALPAFKHGAEQLGLSEGLRELRDARAASAAAASARRPRVPIPGARNVLITSALPYVNNVPHLGNIVGCVLSADVYSRYCRARGYNSVFVCGTDEYGTATETKALEEGLSCQEICDKYHAIHKAAYDWFDIDFDKFGRTPTRAQTEICQDIFKSIEARGHTQVHTNEQLYSLALDKFLADRYVTGTCPRCGYDDARGDQCDNCGALLNPTELVNPRCKFSGTMPVLRETSHVYIDLPALSERLEEYVHATSAQGGWSANCVAQTEAWLRGGLRERCITRDLQWGTPVPKDGFRHKVFYVWFDAPIGYLSITANYTPRWREWWQNPCDVELVQFMGKDNVTFHTIIFPSTLLGTGQEWTLMRKISVTEYLNYEGGKFSKSRGTGVFGTDAAGTGIPAAVFRYYLLAGRPETTDTDFRWADLAERNNSELLNNLGNFVNRTVTFACKNMGGKVPPVGGAALELVTQLNSEVAALCKEYLELLEGIKIRAAIAKVLQVSAAGNKFLQDTQFWVMVKKEPEDAGTVVAAALGLVKVLAALLQPYMPGTTRAILRMLGGPWEWTALGEAFERDSGALERACPEGHALGQPELLFTKIEDATVAELQARFSGNQAADAAAVLTSEPAAAQSTSAQSAQPPAPPAPPATPSTSAAAPGASGKAKAAGGKPAKAASEGASAKGGAKAAKAAAADGAARAVDVSRLDLRVGLITKATKHPNADSLYVEDIDCGEEAPRVVVSGLVQHVPEAEMQNRLVVVVANLKPTNLKSVKSYAMVLAATGPDGKVELVDPPAGSKPGERVAVEGFEGEPDRQLNPKHKIFEAVHPDFSTDGDRVACYRGKPLMTPGGACTVLSVVGATIK